MDWNGKRIRFMNTYPCSARLLVITESGIDGIALDFAVIQMRQFFGFHCHLAREVTISYSRKIERSVRG